MLKKIFYFLFFRFLPRYPFDAETGDYICRSSSYEPDFNSWVAIVEKVSKKISGREIKSFRTPGGPLSEGGHYKVFDDGKLTNCSLRIK